MSFDYSSLPREFNRNFVPRDLKFEWGDISKVFEELKGRNLSSVADLEKWLSDEGELDMVLYEQRTIRYINNSRQTDNPEYQKEYERYTEELEPRIKLASFELLKKFASSPFREGLSPGSYALDSRRRETAVSIFRPENVELQKEDSTLAQNYQRITGAMTVSFRGEERTLQQMAKFYEVTDRPTREEAWRLASGRALADKDSIDTLYGSMVKLRNSEAENAGYESFREYIFTRKNRFDYTPSDCLRFHDAVEEAFVPLSRELDKERMEKMGLDHLMPWDLDVDEEGRPPLTPFDGAAGLVQGCAKVIAKIDGQFSAYWGRMVKLNLLDLDSRKGKAPGGYQEDLAEVQLPFIFMNATGRDGDVRTLLHESGHSFHTFLMRDAGLPYFNAGANLPTEFAEVASMSMEIMSCEQMEGTFYEDGDARRSNKEELMSIVKLFTWVATIDAFQHWVYTHPQHTREERTKAWVTTFDRFSGLESFEGLEENLASRWQRQLHLFEVPFYYIEYGIATLGALGIWLRYKENPSEAISLYKAALSLGASRPLPDLFQAAGLEWNLGPATLKKYSESLRKAISDYN